MANTPVEIKKAAPVRHNMFQPWQSYLNEMDRLFDRFSTDFGLPSFARFWDGGRTIAAPAVDVSEDDKAYIVKAELPGMEDKDIDVSVSNGMLILKGEKKKETEEKKTNYYLSERSYGAFQRAFELPYGVDQEKIAAEFAKGVLTITLPKSAEAQRQQMKIAVKAA